MSRHFVEVQQNIRPKIEALVAMLVDILDQIDGDADLEEDAPREIESDFEPDADKEVFMPAHLEGGNGSARIYRIK